PERVGTVGPLTPKPIRRPRSLRAPPRRMKTGTAPISTIRNKTPRMRSRRSRMRRRSSSIWSVSRVGCEVMRVLPARERYSPTSLSWRRNLWKMCRRTKTPARLTSRVLMFVALLGSVALLVARLDHDGDDEPFLVLGLVARDDGEELAAAAEVTDFA